MPNHPDHERSVPLWPPYRFATSLTVDAAIDFYCQHLGFSAVIHRSPMFAMPSQCDLRLVPSQLGGQRLGGGSTLADDRKPQPGGWNPLAVEVTYLAATVERIRAAGVRSRSDIVQGVGGNRALVEDTSGNPIEPPAAASRSERGGCQLTPLLFARSHRTGGHTR